jgi:hypothetical protein
MKTLLICTVSCLIAISAHGQFLDSLQDVFKGTYNIDARLESRYSFISHRLTSVRGIRGGLAFQRKLRVGGGISWLKSEVPVNFAGNEIPEKYLKFVYVCYYIDFVFYKSKRWQLSVPIQAGTGISWYQKEKYYKWSASDPKYFLLLYEPGITVQFKIFKWLGLGNDVAYRFALNNKSMKGAGLNSPTYSFKLLFWINQLYYELAPKSAISRKYGPAFW